MTVDDRTAYNRVAEQMNTSPNYNNPKVKCETESSGIGSFLDAYRDLLWGCAWPSVRALPGDPGPGLGQCHQHQCPRAATEMAVLKVLGFRPGQILLLVMGER